MSSIQGSGWVIVNTARDNNSAFFKRAFTLRSPPTNAAVRADRVTARQLRRRQVPVAQARRQTPILAISSGRSPRSRPDARTHATLRRVIREPSILTTSASNFPSIVSKLTRSPRSGGIQGRIMWVLLFCLLRTPHLAQPHMQYTDDAFQASARTLLPRAIIDEA
jgi:hypothetical protein